jgi:hypothetical protein
MAVYSPERLFATRSSWLAIRSVMRLDRALMLALAPADARDDAGPTICANFANARHPRAPVLRFDRSGRLQVLKHVNIFPK